MDKDQLSKTAKALVPPGKGILAADWSFPTIEKHFAKVGVQSSEETRRAYREILFTTPRIEEYISGVIMFDETIRQAASDANLFTHVLSEKGIIPGIRADQGTEELEGCPGEKITKGLGGLQERLTEYKNLGARFSKWRAVITVGKGSPTDTCIKANADALARFTSISQEVGLVPIVEPEVLIEGSHDISRSEEVTRVVVKAVFAELMAQAVILEGTLLKPSMVIPGKESKTKASAFEVAETTLRVYGEIVPEEIPGLVFLSGGQTPAQATNHINEMSKIGGVPWEISFSFARALQWPVLEAWQGRVGNKDAAQKAFYERARLNSLARHGRYVSEMEGK